MWKAVSESRGEWGKGESQVSGCCPRLLTRTSRVFSDRCGRSTLNAELVSKAFVVHDHARELFFSSKLNEAQERTQDVCLITTSAVGVCSIAWRKRYHHDDTILRAY